MKWFAMLLALAGASSLALAQTNTPPVTNSYAPQTESYPAAAPAPSDSNAKTRELSLEDCIQMTLQHNIDLRIDRYAPALALYTLGAYYGDYDPSLTISGQHDYNKTGTQLFGGGGGLVIANSISDDNSFSSSLGGLLPWGTTYSLSTSKPFTDTYGTKGGTNSFENSAGSVQITATQPLLKNFWIDTTRLNIRVAKNRVKYSELQLKLQIMQTITTLEQAYYDLIYNRENVVVQEKAVELAMRLAQENKKKVEVGAMAPLDAQQAESQAALSRANLIAARNTLAGSERTMKSLITDKYSDWYAMRITPTGNLNAPLQLFNLQDSWNKALLQRPDYLQAKLDYEKAGIQLKFDKNQLLPQLDVFATYGYNGTGTEFSDALYSVQQTDLPFYTYGGKITFPLANTAARNNYRSAKATMEQSVLSLKKVERDIMLAVDNDIGNAQSSYEQVGATKTGREYAAAALDAEQKKLDSGKSTTYTVLQMQRDLTTARGAEIQALDNYNKALSQLSFDEGTTLQRLNINLDVK
jgi:outer membrane protein TolC